MKDLFTFSGRVVEGNGVGAKFGVATANLTEISLKSSAKNETEKMPEGVFVARAFVASDPDHIMYGVLHVGARLTFGQGETAELHLFDFSGDLYDKKVEVVAFYHLRAVKKFGSGDELFTQIEKDIIVGKKWATRHQVKAYWETISTERRKDMAKTAVRKIQDLPKVIEAKTILGYSPMSDEIPFFAGLHSLFPDKTYAFADMKGDFYLDNDKNGEKIDINDHEGVIFVPALAGNEQGNRLGRGGGNYDKLLSEINPEKWTTITVLPEFANYNKIMKEAHDIDVMKMIFV